VRDRGAARSVTYAAPDCGPSERSARRTAAAGVVAAHSVTYSDRNFGAFGALGEEVGVERRPRGALGGLLAAGFTPPGAHGDLLRPGRSGLLNRFCEKL
jgi:hypothetical protein